MLTLKKFFDWVLTLNLILVTGLCVYLWSTGNLAIQVGAPAAEQRGGQSAVDAETEQLFIATVREEVDRQLGQPIEGYTPDMFLAVFPGLVATDFEDVEASIGKYVVVEGQLVHVTPPNTPLHSAAEAVSSRGLATLLRNIAERTQIDLTNSGTITDIMRSLSAE
ncbi:hypothetical protein CL655_01345 [bacterium]|nr:hypothetical protein [bacterium]|tara:strand:- start:298 stop:792 length:495 start_codon:yes stop_codon:yes gene_type:complete